MTPQTENQFLSFADEVNSAISVISATIEQVVELRDKSVAHLDRKHIDNPSFFLEKPPVKGDELSAAYLLVGSAIFEIGKYLDVDSNIEDSIKLARFDLTKKTLRALSLINK